MEFTVSSLPNTVPYHYQVYRTWYRVTLITLTVSSLPYMSYYIVSSVRNPTVLSLRITVPSLQYRVYRIQYAVKYEANLPYRVYSIIEFTVIRIEFTMLSLKRYSCSCMEFTVPSLWYRVYSNQYRVYRK